MSKHDTRIKRAVHALYSNEEWAREQSLKEAITDAVTDLLTLAAERGIHPGDLAGRAVRHLAAEAPEP
jgi:hypothetical protein